MNNSWNQKKRNVLLFCAVPTQFQELFLFAQLLNETARYKPIFVFDDEQDNTSCISKCLEFGIACTRFFGWESFVTEREISDCKLSGPKTPNVFRSALKQLLPRKIKAIYRYAFELQEKYKRVARNVQVIDKILRHHEPQTVILPIESVGYFFDPVFSLAKMKKISIITIPFCHVRINSTAKWFIEQPFDIFLQFDADLLFNRLVAKKFPGWVYRYGNKRILRANIGWILASERYHTAKADPWIDNSGYTDAVALESPHDLQYYAESKVNQQTLRVIGSLQHDTMFALLARREQARTELCRELNIPYDRGTVILLALPEDFDFGGRQGCEYEKHEDVVKALIQPFAGGKHRIIFTLHPRLHYDRVKTVETDTAKIATRSISELLPCADLFVTVPSAAIRLAVACGVPVLSYDLFQFKDNDYWEAGGIVTVNSYQGYAETAERVLNNAEYLKELKSRQTAISPLWGKMDGLVRERYLTLLKELELKDE